MNNNKKTATKFNLEHSKKLQSSNCSERKKTIIFLFLIIKKHLIV